MRSRYSSSSVIERAVVLFANSRSLSGDRDVVSRPLVHRRATLASMNCPALPQAKVITVINLKGGVGKTHTAWLLSSVCQEWALRLLAVDTDTQANLTN